MPIWGPFNQPEIELRSDLKPTTCCWTELPVSRVTFELSQTQGLQSLAYEFAIDDMTEVLAGLRARHGSPLSTSIEEADSSDQIWVWNTGEDLITAVKRKANDEQKFLLSYRPSRLHPQTL